MKNLSFMFLLLGMLISKQLNGQCQCFELLVSQNTNNSCQFDVSVKRIGACPVAGSINQVTISMTDNISQISLAKADTMVVVALNAAQTDATFTTEFDMAMLPLNLDKKIGSVVLASPVNASQFDGIISGPSPVDIVCTFPGSVVDVACSLLPQTTFDKLYGNADDNFPQKVKGFNNHTYVLASRNDGTTEYATFSKYANDGTLIWHYQMDIPSRLLDFEMADKAENSFMLVGRTEPFQNANGPQDNKSLLVKIRDLGNSGTLVFSRQFAHTGREHFTRIIKHPKPKTIPGFGKFPLYVVGAKNKDTPLPLPANSIDQMMVYCFDKDGVIGWKQQYPRQIELESHRGLFPTDDGNIVVLGNDAPNYGILIQINGQTGAVITGKKYYTPNPIGGPIQYDFNDGLEETPNGEIIIAGTDFTNGKGILLRLSGTASANPFTPLNGKRYDEISEFLELGMDMNGRFFTMGPENVTSNKYHMSIRLSSAFAPQYSFYISDGEKLFKNPRFSVTPLAPRVFYADSRSISDISVNYDMLVGAYDLNFINPSTVLPCIHPLIVHTSAILPAMDSIQVFAQSVAEAITPNGVLLPLPYNCSTFCTPAPICSVNFTWAPINPCFGFQFTSAVTGVAPFMYNWNFGDGSPTVSTQNPSHNFPAPGSYNVCLTIIDATGCISSICLMVIVPPDNIPPLCTVPSNITANTDPGLCSAFLTPAVIGIDNCGPVTVSVVLSGATTGTVLNTNYNKGSPP